MSTKFGIPLFALTALFLTSATAQTLNVKPGLWQVTSTREGAGAPPSMPPEKLAQMQQAMEKMPPEGRARMEAMMKGAGGGSTTSQSCVLAEDLKKPLALGASSENCTRTVLSSSPTGQEIRVECDSKGRKSTSMMKMSTAGPEAWNATLDVNMTGPQGPMIMKTKMAGKWLSSDCGSVKSTSQK